MIALGITANASLLRDLAGSWFDEKADMGHGMLVPVAAAYMVWLKWDELKRLPAEPSRLGLLLVLICSLQTLISVAAHWVWLSRMGFVECVFACVLAIRGWRTVVTLAYPLTTLLLMVPPPTFVFERITLPLQLLASAIGEWWLEILGFSVFREGNILELAGQKLAVEEACSGIRALLALIFFGVIYNFFFVETAWQRVLLLLAVVPFAILGNAARIVATGLAGSYRPEWTHGTPHEMAGYVSVSVAALLCVLFHLLLARIGKAAGA